MSKTGVLLMSNRFSISDIQRATCRHFKIERSQLLSVSQERRLSDPRHIAMALSRQGGRSWEQIGRAFNRDHTIPIYACRKIEKRLAAGCQSTLEAITAIKASLEMTK
jgi:chromosomal replication initiator protein